MKLRQLLYGLSTFVTGVSSDCAKGTGGTDSARYCYSVWLRHLVMARQNGLDPYPEVVAELGPGDSLGIGLAALLSGCDKYYAFDVVEHANIELNLKIFGELIALFKNRADIPGYDEIPKIKPYLDSYDFPGDILNELRLSRALEDSRLERIKESIKDTRRENSLIKYRVPWFAPTVIEGETVDMICSQAVLEHVDNLADTYKAMRQWLRPGGYMSHQIDFRCHGMADEWNGHWTYSDIIWKLIRGRQPYLLNREPHSSHIAILKKEGFKIACDMAARQESNIARDALAKRFRTISEEDLTTSGAFIQAVKQV